MVTKGHNFKRVNLVIVLGIDHQLNSPDFRANEHTYQLLTQVGGRSGRFGQESEVIIQTLNIDNPIFSHSKQESFEQFYDNEIKVRKKCKYPPLLRVVMVYFISKDESLSSTTAQSAVKVISLLRDTQFNRVEVSSARPALIEKKGNKYTWCLMVKSNDINQLHNAVHSMSQNIKLSGKVSIKVDIDPVSIK